MAENIVVGSVTVPVHADTRPFEREIKNDFAKRVRSVGTETADAINDAAAARFRMRKADLRESFARGLIDKREFRKQGAEAAQAFNKEILDGLEKLARSGRLKQADFLRLSEQLKEEGIRGGQALTDGFEEGSQGFQGVLGKLGNAVKVFLGLFIVREAIQGFRRLVSFLRSTADEAETLAKSYLELQATAKLFNIEQREIADLASDAQIRFKLTATAANEIATQVSKLSARAGEAARSQDLLNAALDIGAAQGLDAAATAAALEQVLRGLDEGTDKLLQKNPSVVYAEYAAQIGRSAASLTDLEQKQALFNAVMEAGGRVQGEYQRFLQTSVGAQTEWRNQLQTIREEIGQYVIPATNRLMHALSPMLADATRTVTGLLERMLSPAERIRLEFERMGVAAEAALPLILQERIRDAQQEMQRLEQESQRARIAFDNLRRGPEGPSSGGATEGQPLPRNLASIRAAEAEELANMTRLSAEGEEAAANAARERYNAIRRIRETEEQIATVRAEVADAERQMPELRRRATLRADLADVEAQIARLDAMAESQGEASGTTALRSVLLAKKRGIEEALGLVVDEPTETETPPDPRALEEAKRLAKKRLDIERDLADQVFGITHTLAEQSIRDIDRIGEAYVAAGGKIEDILGQLEALKSQVQVGTVLADFRKEFEALSEQRLSPAILDSFEEFRERLIAQRDQLAEGSEMWERFDALVQRVGGHMEGIRPDAIMGDLQAALDRRMAELREMLARGIIDEKQFKDQGEKAAAAFHAAILAYIQKLRDEGTLSEEVFQALIAKLPDLPVDDAAREAEALARQIDQAATGALKLAEAFGIVDQRTSASLRNIIDLASALPGVVNALSEGGGGLSAALPGIGAIVGATASILATMLQESPEEQERRRVMEENNRRLRELADGIGKLSSELSGLGGANVDAVLRAAQEAADVGGSIRTSLNPFESLEERRNRKSARAFEKELERLGLTLSEAEQVAAAFGITLDGSLESYLALAEAIEEFDWSRLFESLQGQLSLLQAELALFDIEDPIEQLQRMLELFLEFTDLDANDPFGVGPKWIQDLVEGIDVTTAEGRAQLDKTIQRLFEQFAAGELTSAQMGDMSREEFLRFLLDLEALVDQAEESGGVVGATDSTRMSVNITEAQASQLLSLDMTRNRYLEQIVGLLGGTVAAPVLTAPDPSSLGAGGGATYTYVTLETGAVQIPISTTGGVSPEAASRAGEAAGTAVANTLAQRLGQMHRARGGRGAPKVVQEEGRR